MPTADAKASGSSRSSSGLTSLLRRDSALTLFGLPLFPLGMVAVSPPPRNCCSSGLDCSLSLSLALQQLHMSPSRFAVVAHVASRQVCERGVQYPRHGQLRRHPVRADCFTSTSCRFKCLSFTVITGSRRPARAGCSRRRGRRRCVRPPRKCTCALATSLAPRRRRRAY